MPEHPCASVCVCVVSVCLNSLRVSMRVGIAEDVSPNLA